MLWYILQDYILCLSIQNEMTVEPLVYMTGLQLVFGIHYRITVGVWYTLQDYSWCLSIHNSIKVLTLVYVTDYSWCFSIHNRITVVAVVYITGLQLLFWYTLQDNSLCYDKLYGFWYT